MSKTGGGPGSNQYGTRGVGKRTMGGAPAPTLDPTAALGPRRCGDLWNTDCDRLIQAPGWSHDGHPSVDSATAAARNPNTPPEILRHLSLYMDLKVVQEAVASNPNTPPETLDMLTEDSNRNVRRAAAANPYLPASTMKRLEEQQASDNNDYHLTLGLSCNPMVSQECMDNLMREVWMDDYIAINLAQNPSTPPQFLDILIWRDNGEVRGLAAEHPNTRPQSVADMRSAEATLDDYHATPESLLRLEAHDVWWVRERLARHQNTPPEVLATLSYRLDVQVIVAGNSNTPPGDLSRLARSNDHRVRAQVAMNPSAPPEALAILIEDECAGTEHSPRLAAARHPNTPIEALILAAVSSDQRTREIVMARLPETIRAMVVMSGD